MAEQQHEHEQMMRDVQRAYVDFLDDSDEQGIYDRLVRYVGNYSTDSRAFGNLKNVALWMLSPGICSEKYRYLYRAKIVILVLMDGGGRGFAWVGGNTGSTYAVHTIVE